MRFPIIQLAGLKIYDVVFTLDAQRIFHRCIENLEHSCKCKETDCALSTCEKMRRVVNHYRWMLFNKKYDNFMPTQFSTGYASRRRLAPVTFASSCSRCAATTPSSARPPSARCPSATASASTCRGGGSRKMPAFKEGWRRW